MRGKMLDFADLKKLLEGRTIREINHKRSICDGIEMVLDNGEKVTFSLRASPDTEEWWLVVLNKDEKTIFKFC